MSLVQGLQYSPFLRGMIYRGEDGELIAPEYIINNVEAAYQQFISVRTDHIPRIGVYAAIDGMYSGNAPFDQQELEANGLGHLANFNNYKMRAAIDKSTLGLWNLVNSVEYLAKVVVDPLIPEGTRYAEIMSRHYSDLLKEWEDFFPNFNLMGSQLVKYGICPIFYPHEESPMWEVVDVSKFFIPSQTQVFLNKLTNFSIVSTYTVQNLWHIYKNVASEEGPWNKDALGNYLILRANWIWDNPQSPVQSVMDVQRLLDTDAGNAMRYFNDTVRLVNQYQQEYSGKYSHFIFGEDYYQPSTANLEYEKDFLYFEPEQYNSIKDCLTVFTFSPGEWLIHQNVGLGHKIFAPAQAVNMLDCSVTTVSMMSGTPLLRSMAAGGRDLGPIRFYPGVPTDLGAVEFVQNTMGQNIDQMVGAAQYLTNGMRENAINSGDDPQVPDASVGSLSPSQSRSRDFKEYSVQKNFVGHFYNQWDHPILLGFIRFLKIRNKPNVPGHELAKEFYRRCIVDGVPEEMFDMRDLRPNGLPRQFRSVKASRVAGDGSTLARIMGLESLAPIMGTFNDREIANYKREYVTATMGVDYVPMFAASDGQSDEVSGGASLARTEDNSMRAAMAGIPVLPPLFSADNDQAAHADEHMGTASQIVQAVAQQQLSPVDANKFMELMIPHLGEHIQFMAQAPQFYRETLNRLKDPWSQLVKWAQLNKRNAEAMIQAAMRKQQQQAAQQQEAMSDIERKNMVARADIARADFKVQSQVERAKEANTNRAEVMREKVVSDASNKRLQIQLENESRNAKDVEQDELLATPTNALSQQLSGLLGATPSTVDFEG